MSVYFYIPAFHVAAVAEQTVVHDEGEETEHTVILPARPPEIRLGEGNPVVESDAIAGARYRHDSAEDKFVVQAPDGTTARDQWISKTYEQVNTDYPGVF
jgi:hypothetical protein